jgi:hypothetical protein
VTVAVCAVVTADAVAVNDAVVAPAATSTEDGTANASLLLARPTFRPPVSAGAVSVTTQASVPAPVIVPLAHVSPLSTPGAVVPVPLRLIAAVAPEDALLVSVSVPVCAPGVVGLN